MKLILPLILILGAFSGSLYYFRADPPPPRPSPAAVAGESAAPAAPAPPAPVAQPVEPKAPPIQVETAAAPIAAAEKPAARKKPAVLPDFSKMSEAEVQAWMDAARAETEALFLPAQPGEFTIQGIQIYGNENSYLLRGKVTNNGTRTAGTVWARVGTDSDGKERRMCIHAAEGAKLPLAPGTSIVFSRPFAAPINPADVTVCGIELP
jgi:hypothetical protein